MESQTFVKNNKQRLVFNRLFRGIDERNSYLVSTYITYFGHIISCVSVQGRVFFGKIDNLVIESCMLQWPEQTGPAMMLPKYPLSHDHTTLAFAHSTQQRQKFFFI